MKKCSPFGWCLVCCVLFWILVGGVCIAKADSLTFDCTPAGDLVTKAAVSINSAAPVDAALVSTCGNDPATKVTCADPASKTICFPAPTGPFTATATVTNARTTSPPSSLLTVPGVPSSPASLRRVQ
jgi:hypothetical protein